jgi:hypothetical protein
MRTPSDRRGDPDRRARKEPSKPSKRPYRTPRLITHGNLPQLAMAKGGAKGDGPGNPASKA